MSAGRTLKIPIAVAATALVLGGCASAPPTEPLHTPTQRQAAEIREQEIQTEVAATYRTGGDGLLVDMRLHLAWCTHDAQEITDKQQRSSQLQQCHADWPQPIPGQQRPFTTSR